MIKVLSAKEIPPVEEGEPTILAVEIEIDGFTHSVGGLDPNWDRDTLLAHLNLRHDELLANAQESSENKIKVRDDLVDTPARDILAELDEIKARLDDLEKK